MNILFKSCEENEEMMKMERERERGGGRGGGGSRLEEDEEGGGGREGEAKKGRTSEGMRAWEKWITANLKTRVKCGYHFFFFVFIFFLLWTLYVTWYKYSYESMSICVYMNIL